MDYPTRAAERRITIGGKLDVTELITRGKQNADEQRGASEIGADSPTYWFSRSHHGGFMQVGNNPNQLRPASKMMSWKGGLYDPWSAVQLAIWGCLLQHISAVPTLRLSRAALLKRLVSLSLVDSQLGIRCEFWEASPLQGLYRIWSTMWSVAPVAIGGLVPMHLGGASPDILTKAE